MLHASVITDVLIIVRVVITESVITLVIAVRITDAVITLDH